MKSAIKYFVTHFDTLQSEKPHLKIIQQINKLNRKERGELRNQLFERAKFLEASKSPEQIILWLEKCFQIIDKYSFSFNRVFFSPGNGIKESIEKLLREARLSVDLCVFTITDYELARQILACQKRKMRVRIITDDEKILDHGSVIMKLKKAGIQIKTDHSHYHMHNKFGIIDNRIVITGSFNWTYTATKHNQENLLATSNFDIVKQYQTEFNRLWEEMFQL
ncbi:phospholipase D-like domain-containing protein [Maribellus maritimus]|uniref:phospholipase D-like domain-containing protein n=1 Tax=Maribellus maritimus TaxID=2870838 RepID=UPI001EEAF269|nr:phospholipase D-like domain-containing protein [Maribellus maritimus]MCG6186753.1 FAM83 family protein [Maribellus maritimus]